MLALRDDQQRALRYWLPALANGAVVWLLLLVIGQTPLIRASGLALVIVGVTLALRRFGAVLAIIGALVLALSPAFWSQTGGGQGEPATIVIALIAASVTVVLVVLLSKRPYIGLGIGIVVFAVFFWSQIGMAQSLRLTGFVVAWLLFLLLDMLLLTNPRPDEAPLILQTSERKNPDGSEAARPYHILGVLLLLGVGILNDPLLTLLAPSVALSLTLTRTRLPSWYWLAFGLIAGIGLRGLAVDYLQDQAHLVDLWAWRNATNWIDMVRLILGQFTVVGIILSILGLARFARWYPPLGVVSLLAYAAYWFFGLVYSGQQRDVLLLPLFVIQVLWMTYAVLAASDWATKLTPRSPRLGRLLVITIYGLLPLFLFWQILA